jgi:hypothetical protein
MANDLPTDWEAQIARAYAVFAVDPLDATELGLLSRLPHLDVDFLRRKAQDQLRDALGRWRDERGSLTPETRADIPDVDAWDTRNVRKKFKEKFAVPNARLKGKHKLDVPDGWSGQLAPGDSVEVEYNDDGFLRDIKLPGSTSFVSRKELDDLEIISGIRDEETVPDEPEPEKGKISEWLDAWTPPPTEKDTKRRKP